MDRTDDAFRTLKGTAQARMKVQGSAFLGMAAPVQTEPGAEEFIRRVRDEFFDATHHCYAYRLGSRGDRYRLHDDGEPGGTAGRPILTAIDRAGLTDLVLVVTRWFGGTKLGVGGLARAYARTAEGVLAAGEVVTWYALARLRVSFTHDHTSPVMHIIARFGARVAESDYDTQAHLTLEIRRSRADELTAALADATRGAAGIVRLQPATGAAEASPL